MPGRQQLIDWFKQLQKGDARFGQREKAWALVLIALVIFVWGNGVVLSPRTEALRDARTGFVEAKHDLIELEAQRPDLNERREKIRRLQSRVGATFKELEALEEGLLYRQDQDLLLERLVADRKKLGLEINAVNPLPERKEQQQPSRREKEGEAGSFYKKLLVQVDTYAPFDRLVDYLKQMEDMGPYQKAQSLKVRMEKDQKSLPRAEITLEVLLADSAVRKAEMKEKVAALMAELESREKKDPFLAGEKPKEEVAAVGLELSGIFGSGGSRSALINGNPYKVGDAIQGKQIVEIKPDRVVLEQGETRYILTEQKVVAKQ